MREDEGAGVGAGEKGWRGLEEAGGQLEGSTRRGNRVGGLIVANLQKY